MLEVRGLCKSFGGVTAVSDVNLSVDQGRIVSLIGPNGAGKTTLFAMVAGFLKPDSGTVRFQGKDVTRLKPHLICERGMVRTFRVTQPFATLSTLENIMVGAYLDTANRKQAAVRAKTVAERVGMGALLEQPAEGLTVAGRKRLELARALATEPRLLLLDEVMAGLNPSEIDDTVEVIIGIRDSGITIFLIEHVMKAVVSLSDYTYVLNDGVLIAEGTPSAIAGNPDVVEAYLGHGVGRQKTEPQDPGEVRSADARFSGKLRQASAPPWSWARDGAWVSWTAIRSAAPMAARGRWLIRVRFIRKNKGNCPGAGAMVMRCGDARTEFQGSP